MHCKDVSVHETEVSLDEDSIAEMMSSWEAYKRTEYIVFRNRDDFAVVRITSEAAGEGLFRKVDGFEILSLPEDTDYLEDPELDVLNIPALAREYVKHNGRGLVVKGVFSHVVFVKDLDPIILNVVDNVPPSPSKLGVLVRKALDSGFVDLPIVVEERIIDMGEDTGRGPTMFPCKVSGLKCDGGTYYLDEAPKDVPKDITLVGCHLSKRIFESVYGFEPEFVNVCPADFVDGRVKTIVKCCKVKEGYVLEGDTVKVPWGATVPEVVSAINALFSDS